MKFNYPFLTIFFALVILYFSLIPQPIEVQPISDLDKLIHLCSYFLLSFLCFKSINNLAAAIFLAGTYGLVIEIIQLALPYRSFEVFDILINYAGAGLILMIKFRH